MLLINICHWLRCFGESQRIVCSLSDCAVDATCPAVCECPRHGRLGVWSGSRGRVVDDDAVQQWQWFIRRPHRWMGCSAGGVVVSDVV